MVQELDVGTVVVTYLVEELVVYGWAEGRGVCGGEGAPNLLHLPHLELCDVVRAAHQQAVEGFGQEEQGKRPVIRHAAMDTRRELDENRLQTRVLLNIPDLQHLANKTWMI